MSLRLSSTAFDAIDVIDTLTESREDIGSYRRELRDSWELSILPILTAKSLDSIAKSIDSYR